MIKEIRVENFRKSPSNIHHLIIDGDYKTLCGLSKKEDPKLWERQEKGDGLICKNCQIALYNLNKEREREESCDCGGDCGDDCSCEKQEEIPFKEVAFVKKSGSKTQHMAIKGSHKTFCGLTRNSSHLWKYQSLADDTLCKNCSKSFAKSNGRTKEHLNCDNEKKEPEAKIDNRSEREKIRDAKIKNKDAYKFPKAPNDPMPYSMARRRMELEERGFGLEEIKAIMYNEFFGMDMVKLLDPDCGIPECDPEFESTIIGSTTRTDESQSDESLGLSVDGNKELFDAFYSLYRKGALSIDVIRKLFDFDVSSSLEKTERFIELVQSNPTITEEVRQSAREALEKTFMMWKDGCISGDKKRPDHEFFYRVMKIQEVLNQHQ